jgi:hypothetical protein
VKILTHIFSRPKKAPNALKLCLSKKRKRKRKRKRKENKDFAA